METATSNEIAARSLFDEGLRLQRMGDNAAAMAAFQAALDNDPKLVDARRAMRRIDGRAVHIHGEMLECLLISLTSKFRKKFSSINYLGAEQIKSGNGANTEYVAIHYFHNSEDYKVVEKRYIKNSTLPREALVYREVDGLPKGRFYRFPAIYGYFLGERTYSVFMEAVEQGTFNADHRVKLMMKAKALGEFNGRCRHVENLQVLSMPLRDHLFNVDLFDYFRPITSDYQLSRLKNRLTILAVQRHKINVKYSSVLVRGDAQPANLIIDKNRRIVFIDNGRLHRGHPGVDLGNLLWGVLISGGSNVERSERDVLETYERFLCQHGDWTRRDILVGYNAQILRLIYQRLIRTSCKMTDLDDLLQRLILVERLLEKVYSPLMV